METSEPLLHFDHEDKEHDDDEPLLQLRQDEKGGDDDDDDDKPLIQHNLDEDSDSEDDFTPSIRTKTTTFTSVTKASLAFLVGVAIIAVLTAVIALALSAAGLQKGVPDTSTASLTKPTTAANPPSSSPPHHELVSMASCGDGLWKKVAYFDMSDPAQQCPQEWRGYDTPVRCCGRQVSARSSCPSVFYSTGGFKYSRVCGRIIGYQQGSPDCFGSINTAEPDVETVDGIYVDGVSVTHGNPRTHIWTFAAGLHERSGQSNDRNNCPCDGGTNPPSFVGNNYFCETGDDTPNVELHRFYGEDPLWDGHNCHNATCCSKNNPPWFNVQFWSATTDDIEVRICGDQGTGDEDSPIALLEIYVQQ